MAFDLSQVDFDYWKKHKPEGLIGDIIDFSLKASPRPVYEVSLTAALAFLDGMCGRDYSVGGSTLAQYFMLLAGTARGKETVKNTANYLTKAIIEHGMRERLADTSRMAIYNAAYGIVGPGHIASGQAIIVYMADGHPCFVSIIGEFAHKLQIISEPRAQPHDRMLHKMLLELWGSESVNGGIYADKLKNTSPIELPALTLVGESTIKKFYSVIGEEAIYEGFLPRWIIIQYDGPRVAKNKFMDKKVPLELATALGQFWWYLRHDLKKRVVIPFEADAQIMLDELDEWCTAQVNASADDDILGELYGRVDHKVQKLAGSLAVSANYRNPRITTHMIHWAASLILSDVNRMLHKFKRGEIGDQTSSVSKENEIKLQFEWYFHKADDAKNVDQRLRRAGFITYKVIQNRCANRAAFKPAHKATELIKQQLMAMKDAGLIAQVPPKQQETVFGKVIFGGLLYAVTDQTWFFGPEKAPATPVRTVPWAPFTVVS